MTTRRGFIQGVLVAIGAAVLPKVAAAMPIKEPEELFMTEVGFSRDWPGGAKKPIYEYCTAKQRARVIELNELLHSSRVCPDIYRISIP